MSTKILKMDEMRGLNVPALCEYESEVRRRLAMMRMDIFSPRGTSVGEQRLLRKTLARLLTLKNLRQSEVAP